MKVSIATKMEGFYSLKVHGGKRGEIDFGTHKNMILDAGINHMLNGNDPLNYVYVGSGSSQPSAGQVQLDAKFAHTNRNKKETHGYVSADDSGSGKAYGYSRLEVQFDRGAAKGNISEIGVGSNTQGNPLWSRSLILDKSGNPTSITILEDEYLTVTYEARRYVNTETVTTTLQYDDDGEMKSVDASLIQSKEFSPAGWGSAGLSRLGGFITTPKSNEAKTTHAVSDKSVTYYFKYDVDDANNVDINNLLYYNGRTSNSVSILPMKTNLQFNPPLRKTNEFELTIGVTITIERA